MYVDYLDFIALSPQYIKESHVTRLLQKGTHRVKKADSHPGGLIWRVHNCAIIV